MFIHIFNRETVYSHKYLHLINDYFNIHDHLFVFRIKKTFKKFEYPNKVKDNIIFIDDWEKFIIKLFPLLRKSDKVLLHYLAVGPSLYFWFIFRGLLKKTIWVQWGQDLYFYKKLKTGKEKIYEFIRKAIIKRIPQIASIIKEDFELTQNVYHTQAKYYYAFYPNPLNYKLLSFQESEAKEKGTLNIMIGNSADPSNNHLEVFNTLSQAKMDFNIYCPLAYGQSYNKKQEIVEAGIAHFNEAFHYFLERIPPQEYGTFLNGIDIAIMNHRRQQGVGTILGMLYIGKKVFIREEVNTYMYLKRLGLKVYSTNDILKGIFEEIKPLEENYRRYNHNKIKEKFSEQHCAELWAEIFNS